MVSDIHMFLSKSEKVGFELTTCFHEPLLELCLAVLEFLGVACATIWHVSFIL